MHLPLNHYHLHCDTDRLAEVLQHEGEGGGGVGQGVRAVQDHEPR